jgi:hypothetical protein
MFERAHQIVGNSITQSAGSIGLSVERWHSSVVSQCGSTLGKIHPSAVLSPTASRCDRALSSIIGGSQLLRNQVPKWESLKVIALDKFHVNSNLSSGNLADQNPIYQSLTRQILLQKVKTSPYLRLVE